MQRPDGSGGGQPAGMTIGSILRMALKAYAGGGLSSGSAAATGSDFGVNGGLVGTVGPEAANAASDTGGMGLMQMMGNAATSKIGGKGNQQFAADRTPGVNYNSGVITDPMLKFYNPYQQQGY